MNEGSLEFPALYLVLKRTIVFASTFGTLWGGLLIGRYFLLIHYFPALDLESILLVIGLSAGLGFLFTIWTLITFFGSSIFLKPYTTFAIFLTFIARFFLPPSDRRNRLGQSPTRAGFSGANTPHPTKYPQISVRNVTYIGVLVAVYALTFFGLFVITLRVGAAHLTRWPSFTLSALILWMLIALPFLGTLYFMWRFTSGKWIYFESENEPRTATNMLVQGLQVLLSYLSPVVLIRSLGLLGAFDVFPTNELPLITITFVTSFISNYILLFVESYEIKAWTLFGVAALCFLFVIIFPEACVVNIRIAGIGAAPNYFLLVDDDVGEVADLMGFSAIKVDGKTMIIDSYLESSIGSELVLCRNTPGDITEGRLLGGGILVVPKEHVLSSGIFPLSITLGVKPGDILVTGASPKGGKDPHWGLVVLGNLGTTRVIGHDPGQSAEDVSLSEWLVSHGNTTVVISNSDPAITDVSFACSEGEAKGFSFKSNAGLSYVKAAFALLFDASRKDNSQQTSSSRQLNVDFLSQASPNNLEDSIKSSLPAGLWSVKEVSFAPSVKQH